MHHNCPLHFRGLIILDTMEDEDGMKSAIQINDLATIRDLKTHGIPITIDDFLSALKIKSYPILKFFLESDFNINAPYRSDYLPPLA